MDKKVFIAVPMMNKVDSQFMTSMMGLETNGIAKLGVHVGSLVYSARNELTVQALDGGYEYILWLDSDMVFDSDLLIRLMDDMSYGYEDSVSERSFLLNLLLLKSCGGNRMKTG